MEGFHFLRNISRFCPLSCDQDWNFGTGLVAVGQLLQRIYPYYWWHGKMVDNSQRPLFAYFATGWSKETVDCNLFLTDPNFLKSAITQWFLESLYREVLVFGYFKSVRCMEFCLMESFHYRAFPAPYMAWTLIYTLRCIQATNIHTLHLYALRHLLQVSQN